MPRWRFCGDRLKRMGCYVEIDGSYGEGGGQILRTSLSLAALTGQALCLTHIRAARPKPGLAAQHLTAARAVATVCGGQLQGDAFGSQELKLVPGAVRAGPYEFNVAEERGSAGSVGLVLQSVLPPLLVGVGSVEVAVHGGTNVPWSPCFEYLAHVFGPCLALLGAEVVFERLRAGFYPHGGGTIVARGTLKRRLEALVLDEASVLNEVVIAGVVSDRLPAHIGPRQVESCRRQLAEALPQGVGDRKGDSSTWESETEGLNADGDEDLTLDFGFVVKEKPGLPSTGATIQAGLMAALVMALGAGALTVVSRRRKLS